MQENGVVLQGQHWFLDAIITDRNSKSIQKITFKIIIL
jgi:hypothetical protein